MSMASLNRGKIGINKHLDVQVRGSYSRKTFNCARFFFQLDKNGTKTRVVRDFY